MDNTAARMKSAAEGPTEPAPDLGRGQRGGDLQGLRRLLADVFALYVKTKNFHWHMNGRNFRG